LDATLKPLLTLILLATVDWTRAKSTLCAVFDAITDGLTSPSGLKHPREDLDAIIALHAAVYSEVAVQGQSLPQTSEAVLERTPITCFCHHSDSQLDIAKYTGAGLEL
jgi:hypothetical protein